MTNPDPDVQRLTFKKMRSDTIDLLRYMVKSSIDHENDKLGKYDTFENLSGEEQEQALTDYLDQIVREHAIARMGINLVTSHITSYHLEQRRLKANIEAKKIQPQDPFIPE